MTDRIFAIATLSNLVGKLTPAGQTVVNSARHSNDGSQIVLDFNHHRATIDGMFLIGVDVDAVIAGCQILNHTNALALMESPEWFVEVIL